MFQVPFIGQLLLGTPVTQSGVVGSLENIKCTGATLSLPDKKMQMLYEWFLFFVFALNMKTSISVFQKDIKQFDQTTHN